MSCDCEAKKELEEEEQEEELVESPFMMGEELINISSSNNNTNANNNNSNGVINENCDGKKRSNKKGGICKSKVLVYLPTNEIITSYGHLEEKLQRVGWERYPNEDPKFFQFHKGDSSSLLISLPRDFKKFKSVQMYDIVLKNRECFRVNDLYM